jgi:hypothetical protein
VYCGGREKVVTARAYRLEQGEDIARRSDQSRAGVMDELSVSRDENDSSDNALVVECTLNGGVEAACHRRDVFECGV